jgi:GT2 family glycosyltransferase
MKQKNPLISLAILNWNGLKHTKKCLDSLKKLHYSNYEIILVDNGSTDGSKEYFATLKDITFIDLPENTGFTGGHITAAKHAKGEYLAILNNDLLVDPNWISACLETFERHPKAALVGGKSYKWDKTNPAYEQNNSYYAYQEVDPATGYTRTLLVGGEECSVESISGAALLIRRDVIDKVGYFDNDFFAYYEETDLIARMIRAGYEAYYNPEVMTWHKVAGSSKGGEASFFYLYQMHRNRYLYALKNFDDHYLATFQRNYRHEYLKARLRLMRNHRDTDAEARIKAYIWNKKHLKQTLFKRRDVLKLGASYIDKLQKISHEDVTVVIPCYNYGTYVADAIDSVLVQTLKPKKIIIINDGSTDDSAAIIDAYGSNPAIEVIHKDNEGVVGTKNLGLKKSETYWTIFFDADDLIDPEYIQKTVNLGNEKYYDIVYTDMELFGAVSDIFRSQPFSLFPMLQRNFIHNSALIKTSILKQIGGYKPEMKDGLEDWELYLSLIEVGAKPGYLPEAIFKYRQHDASLSRNKKVEQDELRVYKKLVALHPRLFRHMNPTRRKVLRAFLFLTNFIRYPMLWVIVIRTLPRALAQALRVVLHEVRAYIVKKKV